MRGKNVLNNSECVNQFWTLLALGFPSGAITFSIGRYNLPPVLLKSLLLLLSFPPKPDSFGQKIILFFDKKSISNATANLYI